MAEYMKVRMNDVTDQNRFKTAYKVANNIRYAKETGNNSLQLKWERDLKQLAAKLTPKERKELHKISDVSGLVKKETYEEFKKDVLDIVGEIQLNEMKTIQRGPFAGYQEHKGKVIIPLGLSAKKLGLHKLQMNHADVYIGLKVSDKTGLKYDYTNMWVLNDEIVLLLNQKGKFSVKFKIEKDSNYLNKLKKIYIQGVKDYASKQNEATTTASADGYNSPGAFSDNSQKDKKRKKKIATMFGMNLVGKIHENKLEIQHLKNDIYQAVEVDNKGNVITVWKQGNKKDIQYWIRKNKKITESVNEGNAPIKDLIKKMPSHVAGWAKYVAQHKDGEWWYYDDVPKLVPNVGWKSYDRDGYQFSSNIKTNSKGWQSSFQKLKESVNENITKSGQEPDFKKVKKYYIDKEIEFAKSGKALDDKTYLNRVNKLKTINDPNKFVSAWMRLTGATKWDLPFELEYFKESVNEGFEDNFDYYENEMKKRGYKVKFVSHDMVFFYKDYKLGRLSFSWQTHDNNRAQWYISFAPFPKHKKRLFGLLKGKKQLGKMVDFGEGVIDFGEGLFKVDDKKFFSSIIKKLSKAEDFSKKIDKVEYMSPEESERWSHTVFESVNEGKTKIVKRTNRWLELKNDDSMHANKKLAVGLKELKYQLAEVEKFLGWYNKIKNINELESDSYWKRTNNNIYKIKERIVNIAHKLKEIEQ